MPALRLKTWLPAVLLSSVLLCAPLTGLAASEAEAGGDYANAIRLLLEGRLDEARAALENVAVHSPDHAGAWLDLAILQCGLGHPGEAMALFDTIEARFDPPPGIRQLIDLYRQQGCTLAAPVGHGRIRLGRGHDSNANQGASQPNFSIGSGSGLVNLTLAPEFSPRGDGFTALSLDAAKPLPALGGVLLAQYQWRRYDHLGRYDLQTLTLGLEKPFHRNDWEFALAGVASLNTLGTRLYHSRTQVQVRATPPLALPSGWKAGLAASTAHLDYPTLNGYNAQQWEAYGWLTYVTGSVALRFNGGYGADQSRGIRAGGDRDSVFINLNGRMRLGKQLFADFDWAQQRWSDARTYSPGLIDTRRRQETRLWRAALFFPIAQDQGISLEYRDTHNRENISLFEYRSRLMQLSWQMDFTL